MHIKGLTRGPRRWVVLACAFAMVVVAYAAVASGDSAVEPNHGYRALVAGGAPEALVTFDDDAADRAAFAADHGVVPGAAGPFPGSHAGTFAGDAYADLAGDPLAHAASFTAEAWIRWDGGASYDEPVFDVGTAAAHLSLTPAASADGHPLRFAITTAAGTGAVEAPTLRDGWHHVAVTEDAGTLTLYVDGIRSAATDGVAATPADLPDDAVARLGAALDETAHLHGALADVAFYPSALSATAVKAHYDAAELPVVVSAPGAGGTPRDGETLTADPGTWGGASPITYTYRWQRDDGHDASYADLDGATGQTYAAGPADVGHTLRVVVTATNGSGATTAPSAPTAVVAPHAPVAAVAPEVSGTARDGGILTAGRGTWTGTDPITYTYRWQRDDGHGENYADVDGATAATYTAASADVAHRLRVVVTATNAGGATAATSAPSAVIAAVAPRAAAQPEVSGDARHGATLTADHGAWSGTTPLAYTYQWRACDADGDHCATIDGATGATYAPGGAAVGHTLRAAITATNDAGSDSAVSAPTAVVATAAPIVARPTAKAAPTSGLARLGALDDDTCTITWTGTGGNPYWANGANWSTGVVPTASDTACAGAETTIELAGGDGTAGRLLDDGTLRITSNTLTIAGLDPLDPAADPSSVAAFELSGGGLSGAGTFAVAGTMSWSGGSLQGTGTTVVDVGATATANTCTQYWCGMQDSGRTLRNEGTLTISSGTVSLSNDATVENEGTLEVGPDSGGYASLTGDGGTAVVNDGTLRTRGAGSAQLSAPLSNPGTVRAVDGTALMISGGSTGAPSDGLFTATGTGAVHFQSNTFHLGDASLAGDVVIDGATVDAAGAVTQHDDLAIAGGTVQGSGTLELYGTALWTGGSLQGTGRTIVHTGGVLQSSTCTQYWCSLTDNRPLDVVGDLRVTDGTIALNAAITNSGTLTIGDDDGNYTSIDNNGGGTLVSTGALVTRGNAQSNVNVPIDNEGSVTVIGGTKLYLQGGQAVGTPMGGTWATAGSGELHFNTNSYRFGDTSIAGNVFFDGATIETAGTLDQTSGTLRLTGGAVTGAGTLRVHDQMRWDNGGGLQGSGQTTVLSGATLQLVSCTGSGCGLTDDQRALVNQGALRLTDGSLTLAGNAVLTNDGTFTQGDDDGNYTALFNTAGTFVNHNTYVTRGNATNYENVPIDNEGSTTVVAGTKLYMQSGQSTATAMTGTWATAGSGELHFNSGSYKLGSTSVAGNVFFDGATIETAGTLEQTGTLRLTGGSVTGAGTLRVHDQMQWVGGGGLQGSGQTTVLSGGTLQVITCTGGGCSVTDNQRSLVNQGALNLTDGSLALYGDAVLTNDGTLTQGDDDGNYTSIDNGGGTLVNNGTFLTRGNATNYVNVPFDNEGSVTVVAGTKLYPQGGGVPGVTATGDWGTAGNGELHFNSNTFNFGTGTSWSGNVWVDGATIQTIGTVQQSGALALSGGTVTGAGTLRVGGAATWTGGTQSGSGSTVVAPGGTLQISTCTGWCGVPLNQRVLHNEGTSTITDGILSMYNGAKVLNDGTFAIGDDDGANYTSIDNSDGTALGVVNDDTFTTRGNYQAYVGVPFENRGSVAAVSGTLLRLTGGTPGGDFGLGGSVFGALTGTSNGSWSAATGALIDLQGGTYLLGAGAGMAGAVKIDGSATVVTPDLDGPTALLTVDGGRFAVSDPAGASTVSELNLYNGTLGGVGDLHVADHLTWTGGTMQDPGRTTLDQDGTGTIGSGGNTIYLNGRVLDNVGHMTWNAGYVQGDNNGLLDNNGVFDANADETTGYGGMYNGYGNGGILYNTGVFQKVLGTGTTNVGWAVADSGTIVAHTGKLNFTGPRTRVTPGAGEQRGPGNAATPNVQRSCAGDPVDCATGNQLETQSDVSIPGRGLGLSYTRTYNSQAAVEQTAPGANGYGWSATYSDHLDVDTGSAVATVRQADGSATTFIINPNGTFQAPTWVSATLVRQGDGTYRYTLPSGVVYAFDADGRLTSEADRAGETTTLSYDGSGRLSQAADAGGRTLAFAYNGDGTVASVTDPAGTVITYSYSGGDLAGVALDGVSGDQWAFGYDGDHQMTSLTDANGHTTTTGYDGDHRAVTQTDAAARTRTWDYDGNVTTITNPAGDVTRETFSHGEPTEIIHAYGTAKAATQTITYDASYQAVASTDADDRTTTYAYDAAGNRTSVTDPDSHTTTWTYDDHHDVLTVQTAAGRTTTMVYDGVGNRTSSTQGSGPAARTTAYGYDGHGQLTSITDPLSHTWSYEHDAHGDVVRETTPEGDEITHTYDDDSRLLTTTSARGNAAGSGGTTTYTRDAFGRATGVEDPLGHTTTSAYDGVGNVIDTTDATGRTVHTVYDAVDEPVETVTGGTAHRYYDYDDDGQVVGETDPDGHTTTYDRDVTGRVVETTDPLGRHATTSYTDAGRPAESVDALGRHTEYTYNGLGLVTELSHPDAPSQDVTLTYNADGQRTAMDDASGETTYSYDSLGRLTGTENGHGDSVGYGYDAAGHQTTLTYPNGHDVTRDLDDDGRVTGITDWLGHTTSFDYDADSDPTGTTFPTSTGRADARTFDAAGGLSGMTYAAGGSTTASLAYGRDDAGRITGETRGGALGSGSQSTSYDARGRLSGVNTSSYNYDLAGQPTQLDDVTAMSYDDAGQLTDSTTAAGTTTYDYDDAGERTSTTAPAGGGTTTFTYNAIGGLASVAPAGGGATVSYGYDGDGLRVSRTRSGVTTHLTWDTSPEADPALLLAEGSKSYIYDPQGLPLEQIDGSDVVYFHHDVQGSTRSLSDASGATVATFTYNVLGAVTATTGTATTSLLYGGQYTDAATGLIYLRARDYDPATGQFLTRDPLESTTHQPYTYAGGDPVDFADPSGLCFGLGNCGPIDTVGNAVGGAVSAAANYGNANFGVVATVLTGAGCVVSAGLGCAAVVVTAGVLNVVMVMSTQSGKQQTVGLLSDLAGTALGLFPVGAVAKIGGREAFERLAPGALEHAVAAMLDLPGTIYGLLDPHLDDCGNLVSSLGE